MEKILKYKNKIIIFSIILIGFFTVFILYRLFSGGVTKEVLFDFSKNYSSIEFINDEMYIFEKDKFYRYDKNGKVKKEKTIQNTGKVKVSNNVIYSLNSNTLTMYSTNFDEVKKINLSGESTDFFIESNKLVLLNNATFKIFDETLNEIYSNTEAKNPIYLKFSKSEKKFVYTDYVKKDNQFKSRFHIVDLKEKKSVWDFSFYNEFIIDVGFVNDSNDNIYVVTNEKLYLFEGSTIKNQYFLTNLKDIYYDNGKIYLLSDNLQIFDSKELKLEKEIKLNEEYKNMFVLDKNILLTKKVGYSLLSKSKFEFSEFSADIVDIIRNQKNIYLILTDRYKKLK